MTPPSISLVRIWDLPTRVFHVLLALCVIGLVISGEVGGDAMQLHFWMGYAVLTLLFFRLIWGVLGGHWSRFVNFVPSPARLRAYVTAKQRHESPAAIGHNPLGALSVLAMLLVLLLQVFSGFMSDDEISVRGPWVDLVPNTWLAWTTPYHTEVGKLLVIVLSVLHVASVLFYRFIKLDDLITPMANGDKLLPQGTRCSRDTPTSRLFALGVWVGCVYAVYRLVLLGS